MKKTILILISALSAFCLSCEKLPGTKEKEPETKSEVVTTMPAEEWYFGCNVGIKVNFSLAGSYKEFQAGICYSLTSTEPALDVEDCANMPIPISEWEDKNQPFIMGIVDMKPAQTVYYRAWAKFDDRLEYGAVISATTKALVAETSKEVDLGLSVKWAGYNLGASKPEDGGDFYAWGETKQHTGSFSLDNAPYYADGKYTKYNETDGLMKLESADDAAAVNWGSGWRMPTNAEKLELLRNCEVIAYTLNEIPGVYLVSKVNGKAIFFPYTGGMLYGEKQYADKLMGFWVSDRHENVTSARICCNRIANSGLFEWAGLSMETVSSSFALSELRYRGYSIRAVKQ